MHGLYLLGVNKKTLRS